MKIPILLEITPIFNAPVIYRPCARCERLIGPFINDPHRCAETSYCQLCRSVLDTKRQATQGVTT